jgi:hypothetical protein
VDAQNVPRASRWSLLFLSGVSKSSRYTAFSVACTCTNFFLRGPIRASVSYPSIPNFHILRAQS